MRTSLQRPFLLLLALLLFSAWQAQAQQTVRGRVTTIQNDEPLIGVSILVKGTSRGTVTDIDGRYEVQAVPTDVLIFSYTGMQTQEIEVGAATTLDVEMDPSSELLSEVVVTGYGEQLRSSYTGSAVTVEPELLEQAPRPTFQESLQGNVPGLFTTQGSGQPGAFQQVRIRGQGSINASNEPLYVIDGIPVYSGSVGNEATTSNALAGLNPNDIESVNVLKDASATSIYGSRGANGVIIITTKQGRPGRPRVTANVQTGIADITLNDRNRPPNTPEYLELMREGLIASGNAANPQEANDIIADNIQDTTVNTNWFDELTRQGNTTQANLSVSGGDQRTTYYISGGYFDQDGVILASDFQRVTAKLGLKTQATDWLQFDVNVSANNQRLNTVPDGGAFANPVRSIYRFVPVQPVFNEDGSYNTAINAGFNSVGELNENIRRTDILNLLAGIRATVDLPLEGLSYTPQVNYNRIVTHDETWENPFFGSGQSGNGEAESDYEEYFDWLVRNQINYSTYINDAHGIDIQLGHEAQKRRFQNTQTQVSNFAFPDLITQDNGSQPDFITGSKTESTIESIFLNASYNYQGLFYLNGTVRRDGSSRFGADNRYGTFWSVGGSVNLHRMNFLSGTSFLNTARVRASYGVNGNQEIGNFASRGLYSTGEDYNGEPGIILTQLENANLTWEENKPFNIGIDLGLWNRVDLTLDFYSRRTSSLLFDVPVSRTNGIAEVTSNIGELENRGVEIALFTRNIVNPGGGFEWTTNFNITFNKNEVLSLPDGDFNDGSFRRMVGQPWNTWYMRGYAGVDVNTGEPLWYLNDEETETTTNYNEADQYAVAHGHADPDFYGGLTNTFTFKGISLSALFYFVSGNTILHSWHRFTHTDGARGFSTTGNVARSIYDRRWQNPGDVTDVPQFIFGNNTNSNERSSRFLHDGTYVRLRDVTLSYTFPQTILDRLRLTNLRLFARANNLWTYIADDRLERDPQVDFTGFLDQEIPISKTWTFGVDLSF